jgi:Ser/Thr protein kinase RdoA (MazF antagonist)
VKLGPSPAGLVERLEAIPWSAVGGGVCAVGVRRLHERPESTVAELLQSDGRRGRELVFKVQRTPPAAESARREYEALGLLHGIFSQYPGFGVPRALRLDGATLLMEPCRGRPLDVVVREARRAPARQAPLDAALRRTGRWLRLLQQGTADDGDAGRALAALLTRARHDLETCAGRGLGRRAARATTEQLHTLAADMAPRTLRLVGRHADFWPGNVFMADERVEVIDFEGFGHGLPYEDAAYFLVQLELFYAYPLIHRSFRPRAAAFLEGYLASEELDPAGFELARRAKALQILAQGLGGNPASSPLGGRKRRALAAIARGAWS